jgi:hypothetical protein
MERKRESEQSAKSLTITNDQIEEQSLFKVHRQCIGSAGAATQRHSRLITHLTDDICDVTRLIFLSCS